MDGTAAARVMLRMVAIVTPLYWMVFFATGSLTPSPSDCRYRFEPAFPGADLWMAATAAVAAAGLARGRRWGRAAALLTAGSLIYLAAMDILFDLENGVYIALRPRTLAEVIVNLSCLGFGIYLTVTMLPEPAGADAQP